MSTCLFGTSLEHDGRDIEDIYLDDIRSKTRNYLGAYEYENSLLQSGIIIKALTVFEIQDSADDYAQIAFDEPLINKEGKIVGIKSKNASIGHNRLDDLNAEVLHRK